MVRGWRRSGGCRNTLRLAAGRIRQEGPHGRGSLQCGEASLGYDPQAQGPEEQVMTAQFDPRNGGRGIEWCDETRNATGGCIHGCQWQMPDGTVATCYAKDVAENGVAKKAYPHGFEHH